MSSLQYRLGLGKPSKQTYKFMEKRLDICSQMRKVSCRNNPCEDRISCLPDEILYFVQSFLDYDEVAQMSILSRRWLSLWMHAPLLTFGAPLLLDLHLRVPVVPDGRNQKRECRKLVSSSRRVPDGRKLKQEEGDESSFRIMNHAPPDKINQNQECDKIVNWMSRVSRMHKDEFLNELRVSYTLYKCFRQKDIYSWFENTVAREVGSLDLIFSSIDGYPNCQDSSYVFPDRLLSYCSDCFYWTLSSNAFGSHFLESSGFKSLKSLSLNGILITQKSINFFLLNCPFLERLEVVNSPMLIYLKISGQSLALKYLKIEGCYNLFKLYISDCNIVSLKISAVENLVLLGLPLIELSIDGTSKKFVNSFTLSSDYHPQLEALTLSTKKPKAIVELTSIPERLKKLKRLVINVNASGDKSLIGLISLINACPRLEEFVLKTYWTKPRRSSRMLKRAEKHRLKSLKVVEFLGYYGRVSDVELIVYLMENAKNLEKVIIDPRNPQHMEHCNVEEAKARRRLTLRQLKGYIPPLVQLVLRCLNYLPPHRCISFAVQVRLNMR